VRTGPAPRIDRVTASGSILFLIPARGGSRRVPGKNLRRIGGIPLVGQAVRIGLAAARATGGGPHRVVCSTDDRNIAASAAVWGAEVLDRPAELATDEAASVDVALHALDALEARHGPFEALALLQPTSPLTDPADVAAAIERHRRTGGASITSVVENDPPSFRFGLALDGTLQPAGDDSAAAPVRLAGAFYVIAPGRLRSTKRFVEPRSTVGLEVPPARAIDVDGEVDLLLAEAILAARPVRPVRLGRAEIGNGRTYVIAEAGVNHNGDLELARRLVDAAAASGADAVKFQTFDPAALAAGGAPTAEYQREAGVAADDQRQMLAGLVLPRDCWAELQARATSRGLAFLSTPFDDGSADVLDALDVPAFKVGSGELTNTPFIARLARRGRPLLVSTGMADIVEVAAAVDAVRASGDPPLALFHCVSTYPAAAADANLRAIETLRRAFGVPVGWSDHTTGIDLPVAAVAAGASMIEKHLTLDRTMQGPDHRASLEPDAFTEMVAAIRRTEAALGTGVKAPATSERDVAAVARRSLFWRVTRPAGHVVTEADLDVLRPASGMPPSRLAALVGGRTSRAVEAGTLVAPGDVEREAGA
jgi:N,N'-diacetyllegionaminate synthase